MSVQTQVTTYEQFIRHLQSATTLTLIASVTRECVLRCKYCYARDPGYRPAEIVMPDDLLEKLVCDAFDVRHRNIGFEWTGGEPLLGGRRFFERVLEIQEKHVRNGKTYANCVQTSGAHCDESLYDFLIENKITLSLTIDGPRDLHDFQRPAVCGKSFENVMKSYEYIRKKQGWCGVLCTITKASLSRMQDIIDFYRERKVESWYTNAYIHDPRKPVREESLGLAPQEVASYFKGQVDSLLEMDCEKAEEGYLDFLMTALAGIRTNIKCSQGGRCVTNYVNIDDAGNATLCPKFIGYDEFRLGNIREASIAEMISIENPVMERLVRERLAAINSCEEGRCEYFLMCRGGCPYYSYLNGSDGSVAHRSLMCDGKRELCRYIDDKLQSYGVTTITCAVRRDGADQDQATIQAAC